MNREQFVIAVEVCLRLETQPAQAEQKQALGRNESDVPARIRDQIFSSLAAVPPRIILRCSGVSRSSSTASTG